MAARAVARVNGVALHAPGEALSPEELRQRACTELLRQAAMRAACCARTIRRPWRRRDQRSGRRRHRRLLDRALQVPEPSDEACRRHYAAHAARYRTGERVRLRHILFAVTPGVESWRCASARRPACSTFAATTAAASEVFAEAARELSNCPSGAAGGDLGWLAPADCAPEFARELFGRVEVGVLPRLVHSRFGLHVVEVLEREHGHGPAFEAVRGAVALRSQQAWVTALRQLQLLAGQPRWRAWTSTRPDAAGSMMGERLVLIILAHALRLDLGSDQLAQLTFEDLAHRADGKRGHDLQPLRQLEVLDLIAAVLLAAAVDHVLAPALASQLLLSVSGHSRPLIEHPKAVDR